MIKKIVGKVLVGSLVVGTLAGAFFGAWKSVDNQSLNFNFNAKPQINTSLSIENLSINVSKSKSGIVVHAATKDNQSKSFVENEILVQFKSVDAKRSFAVENGADPNQLGPSQNVKVQLGNTSDQNETLNKIEELKQDSRVVFAEPNFIKHTSIVPNDTYYSRQWHYKNPGTPFVGMIAGVDTNAERGWDITTGSPSVTIAVIDEGVDISHPDLTGNILRDTNGKIIGRNIADNCDYTDAVGTLDTNCKTASPIGHGTLVAGAAAAVGNNGIGVSGMCQNCKIMPIGIHNSLTNSLSTADEANGIYYAINNGAKIINLSLGGPDQTNTEKNAIAAAISSGITVVASAGNCGSGLSTSELVTNNCFKAGAYLIPICNDTASTPAVLLANNCTGPNELSYPASYSGVLSVSGFSFDGTNPRFSANSGVGVSAPGVYILSTIYQPYSRPCTQGNSPSCCPDNVFVSSTDPYCWISGTSFSSPLVAGLAGLILSKTPSLTNSQVIAKIKSTSNPFVYTYNPSLSGKMGAGAIDVCKALDGCISSSSSSTTSSNSNSSSSIVTSSSLAAPSSVASSSSAISSSLSPTVAITGISILGSQYQISFTPTNYTPTLGGIHTHFYYDTEVSTITNKMFSGPSPYLLNTSTRPASATQICAVVGNPNHTIIPNTGNCFVLPSVSSSSSSIATLSSSSTSTSSTALYLTVNLLGFFDSALSNMKTTLNTMNLIPRNQPFNNSSFNYTGQEVAAVIPSNIVDWILVEIKDQNGNLVDKKAGLLDTDGNFVDPVSLVAGVNLSPSLASGAYSVNVRHLNHIAIGTNTPIFITPNAVNTLDFTANINVKSSNQVILSTGKYAMRSANPNGDAYNDSLDRTVIQGAAEANNVYSNLDVNRDGSVDSQDRTIVLNSTEVVEATN